MCLQPRAIIGFAQLFRRQLALATREGGRRAAYICACTVSRGRVRPGVRDETRGVTIYHAVIYTMLSLEFGMIHQTGM